MINSGFTSPQESSVINHLLKDIVQVVCIWNSFTIPNTHSVNDLRARVALHMEYQCVQRARQETDTVSLPGPVADFTEFFRELVNKLQLSSQQSYLLRLEQRRGVALLR